MAGNASIAQRSSAKQFNLWRINGFRGLRRFSNDYLSMTFYEAAVTGSKRNPRVVATSRRHVSPFHSAAARRRRYGLQRPAFPIFLVNELLSLRAIRDFE